MGSKHRVSVGARAKTLLWFFSSHSRSNSLFDSIDDFIAFLLRLKLQNTTLVFFAFSLELIKSIPPQPLVMILMSPCLKLKKGAHLRPFLLPKLTKLLL